MEKIKLYRMDLYYDYCENQVLFFYEYEVMKETEKSYIIQWPFNKSGKKIILKESRKAFARNTKEKALKDFMERKTRYLCIMNYNTEKTNEALTKAKNCDIDNLKTILHLKKY